MEKMKIIKNRLMSKWFVCRVTSGRKSAQYGIRFSYPVYILLVVLGVIFVNPYILSITALIALLGIILPMHPFDYLYNFGITQLFKTDQIPGRGSELQINSSINLLFNFVVLFLIIYDIQLNYAVMALIYVLSSTFFVIILLFTEDFSLGTIKNLFIKRGRKH